jgi:hypothetical protein
MQTFKAKRDAAARIPLTCDVHMTISSSTVDPALKQIFISNLDRATEVYNFHRKKHMVFFEVQGRYNRASIDLCDAFNWCKHSKLHGDDRLVVGNMRSTAMLTHITSCVAIAQAMTNAQECTKLLFVQDANTVQLRVWREKSDTPILIGLALMTPNRCAGCGLQADTSKAKLKSCSRCYHNTRVRVLYCGKECQQRHYSRHSNACLYDWSAEDWHDDELPKH